MESTPAVDSSPHIWSICLSHADKFDRALVETWKGDMDGILIFVGLFHIDPFICLLTLSPVRSFLCSRYCIPYR